jgi:hypothetical protein
MNDPSAVWLAVMAVSLAIMAAVQIGLIIVVLRLAREATRTAAELRQEIRPLIAKAHQVMDDAAKATALAALQVERVDAMLNNTGTRIDQAVGFVQNALGGPIQKGFAAFSILRAVMSAFRGGSTRRRRSAAHQHEEEDALFVG